MPVAAGISLKQLIFLRLKEVETFKEHVRKHLSRYRLSPRSLRSDIRSRRYSTLSSKARKTLADLMRPTQSRKDRYIMRQVGAYNQRETLTTCVSG